MNRTKRLAYHGIFLALFIVTAKISFTVFPPVPFTLQSAAVILCALVMGWQSAFTVAIYILLGIAGLPVFAMGGGVGYLLYPTFGFTLGFLVCGFVTGLIYSKKKTVKNSVVAVIVGTLIIYICGISYYLLLKNFYFGESVDIWKTLMTFYVVFIPSDLLKGAICIAIARRVKPLAFSVKN